MRILIETPDDQVRAVERFLETLPNTIIIKATAVDGGRRALAEQLAKESRLVAAESMAVLTEFESLDDQSAAI